MTSKGISRFVPNPKICFILTGILLLVAGSLASSNFVVRNRVDDYGQVMRSPDGLPLIEVDQWASYWNGWPSNIPVTGALVFFVLGIALLIHRKLADGSQSTESKRPIKAQMATPRKPFD